MNGADHKVLRFEGFVLDPARRSLARNGEWLKLRPQAMEVLCHLALRAGQPVSKSELFNSIWPGISVTDDSLVQCVREIRRVLQDHDHRIVKTVPRRGYLFAGLSAPDEDGATPAIVESRPPPAARATLHGHPLLAVTPFSDLGGQHDEFAEGLAEELITALFRIRWLTVMARRASASPGAHYRLQGSVRYAGERIRVTAHLFESATGVCLWSDAYDRRMRDRLAVQEEIASLVAATIEGHVIAAEGARARQQPVEKLLPWDVVARARAHFAKVTKNDATTGIALLTSLVDAHPDYAAAQSLLGFCLVNAAHMGWIAREAGLPFGHEHAVRALALDDRDAWAHIALGYWAMMERRTEEAIAAFRRAVALNPNSAASRSYLSRGLAFAGRHREAIEHGEEAVKLGPADPQKALFLGGIAVAKYAAGRFEEVVRWSIEAQRLRPGFQGSRRMLCAGLALAGRTQEARGLLAALKRDQPGLSMDWLRTNVPYQTASLIERYEDGMWRAGLR